MSFFSSGLAHCLASVIVILIHLVDEVSLTVVSPNEKSRTFRPLDRRPLYKVSLDKTSLGRRFSWTTRPFDDVSLDDAFLSHGVPDRCVLILDCIDVFIVTSYFGLGFVAYGISVFVFSSFAKVYVFSFCSVCLL